MSNRLLRYKIYPLVLALGMSQTYAGLLDSPENMEGPFPDESIVVAQNDPKPTQTKRQLSPEETAKLQEQLKGMMSGQVDPSAIMDMGKSMGLPIMDPTQMMKGAGTSNGMNLMQGMGAGSSNTSRVSDNVTSVDQAAADKVRAQIAEAEAKERAKKDAAMDDEAFQLLLTKALPLSPEQIKLLRKYYDISQQATAETPNAPPTPISSSSSVSLEPGMVPPVVRLSAGFVTSLVFTDSTGSPWPIVSYTLGDPSTYNIQWNQRSNTMFIQSLSLYNHGNLAVTLQGNTTPVMISLVSGQKEVDFRIDYQVAGRGPKASAPIVNNGGVGAANVSPILINVLDGIPPKGSTKLQVSGGHGDAWLHNNKLYFRTKVTVLSPAWTGTVSSSDGTRVYEMMNTPSILASVNGQTVDIRLTGL